MLKEETTFLQTMTQRHKTVYYGNTAKDAGEIGFRDDAIYKWLDKPNKNMLNLIQRDRGMTINSFRKYADSEHTLY